MERAILLFERSRSPGCPCGLFEGSVLAALSLDESVKTQEGYELTHTNHGRFHLTIADVSSRHVFDLYHLLCARGFHRMVQRSQPAVADGSDNDAGRLAPITHG